MINGRRKIVSLTFIITAAFLAFSNVSFSYPFPDCNDTTEKAERMVCNKEWSIFVYMNADNDLSMYSLADIYEMEAIGSNEIFDLVVQLDTKQDTGLKRFLIKKNPDSLPQIPAPETLKEENIFSPILETLPEDDSGKAIVFYNFLKWATANFPAKHYMVILWSHGKGFSGISFEESSKKRISIPALRYIFRDLADKYNDHQKIDIYASDACLMNTIEVAYEMNDVVNYSILGSAKIQNYLGFPYKSILQFIIDLYDRSKPNNIHNQNGYALNSHLQTKIPEHAISYMIPLLHQQSYNSGYQGSDSKLTMAASITDWATREIQLKLNSFAKMLNDYIDINPVLNKGKIKQEIENTFSYKGAYFDLYHFTTRINYLFSKIENIRMCPNITNLNDQTCSVQKLQDAISKAVINYSLGEFENEGQIIADSIIPPDSNNYFDQQLKGLTVWLPTMRANFDANISIFKKSRLYKETPEWGKFINNLYPSLQ